MPPSWTPWRNVYVEVDWMIIEHLKYVHNQTMCLLSILGTFEEFTFHLHLYPVDLSRVEYVRIRLPRLTET